MKKKTLIFVLLAAFLLSAVDPWPAVLTVVNYTGENVYIWLKYRGVQKYYLVASSKGNSGDYNVSRFDIARRTYTDSKVVACQTSTTWARFNLNQDLRLTFTECAKMKQIYTPKYWGVPGDEKPNFFSNGVLQHVPPYGPWWGSYDWKCPGYVQYCLTTYGGNYGPAFRFLYKILP